MPLTVESLAVTVEGQAEWRDHKAEEFPDDYRNAAAASALRELAEWIRDNPEHPSVQAVMAVQEASALDLENPTGEHTSRMLSRYGYDPRDAEDPSTFLRGLAMMLQDEVQTLEAEMDGDSNDGD